MSHGVTYHGGFKVGDKVQLRDNGRWDLCSWTIERFEGMKAQVRCDKCRTYRLASIENLRHPHLVEEVQKRHGSRA